MQNDLHKTMKGKFAGEFVNEPMVSDWHNSNNFLAQIKPEAVQNMVLLSIPTFLQQDCILPCHCMQNSFFSAVN